MQFMIMNLSNSSDVVRTGKRDAFRRYRPAILPGSPGKCKTSNVNHVL